MFDRATYNREYQRRQLADNPIVERERRKQYAKKYRDKNREKTREASRRYRAKLGKPEKSHFDYIGSLWSKYRMTPEQYAEMLANQNGVCAFCLKGNEDGRRLCVDHDHTKPKGEGNRWLLCHPCNSMIGHGKDSPALLRVAADKLEEYYGGSNNCSGLRRGSEGATAGCCATLSLPG